MPQRDFFEVLARGIDALRADVPLAYHRFQTQFGPLRASLTAGTDTRTMWLENYRLVLVNGVQAPAIEARFGLDTIDRLLDGEMTLLDAVQADRLWIRGRPEHVERFFDAFATFVTGGMRSHAMQRLLQAFRGVRER